MEGVRYYAKDLFQLVYNTLSELGSDAVYIGNRPNLTDVRHDSFFVVSIPYGFEDLKVLQKSIVRIELFVRCKRGGIENLALLQDLCEALTDKFPIADGRTTIHHPELALKGNDVTGFSAWVIQATADINTTDRINIIK